MRPDIVVVSPLLPNDHLSLPKRVEDLTVEEFIPETGIEAFAVSTFPGKSRFDEGRLRANNTNPVHGLLQFSRPMTAQLVTDALLIAIGRRGNLSNQSSITFPFAEALSCIDLRTFSAIKLSLPVLFGLDFPSRQSTTLRDINSKKLCSDGPHVSDGASEISVNPLLIREATTGYMAARRPIP
jgi:hypothetical protein